MKFTILLFLVATAARAEVAPICQPSSPNAFFSALGKECHGPDDCAPDEYCWTPGVCIPATCRVDSDCAMHATCHAGWCQYGE
ncbi:MAG: hypothetical protein ACXVB9_07760 [Bdellovibrionota bacterium]